MTDLIKELLAADALPITTLPATSRYAETPVKSHQPDGEGPATPYLARRFCPQPDRFTTQYEVTVVESDRKDTLAARHLGDHELWWRLADANAVIDPRHLTHTPGTRIRITLAADIEGAADD